MAASAEEIKAFLAKRGYEAEVKAVKPGNFQVSLHCKSVDEVAGLFAGISEGSRFIVSVHHPDIIELVEAGAHLGERFSEVRAEYGSAIGELQASQVSTARAMDTDNAAFRKAIKQLEERLAEIRVQCQSVRNELEALDGVRVSKIKGLEVDIARLQDRLDKEERKPWWRKPWRSK